MPAICGGSKGASEDATTGGASRVDPSPGPLVPAWGAPTGEPSAGTGTGIGLGPVSRLAMPSPGPIAPSRRAGWLAEVAGWTPERVARERPVSSPRGDSLPGPSPSSEGTVNNLLSSSAGAGSPSSRTPHGPVDRRTSSGSGRSDGAGRGGDSTIRPSRRKARSARSASPRSQSRGFPGSRQTGDGARALVCGSPCPGRPGDGSRPAASADSPANWPSRVRPTRRPSPEGTGFGRRACGSRCRGGGRSSGTRPSGRARARGSVIARSSTGPLFRSRCEALSGQVQRGNEGKDSSICSSPDRGT